MAQSTTNLGKIHVFPSEALYNQFKDIIADNDLALLKDDGAYIVAALLEQNGYVKFSNGLILQWGYYPGQKSRTITFPLAFNVIFAVTHSTINSGTIIMNIELDSVTNTQFKTYDAVLNNQYDCPIYWIAIGF